MPITNQNCAHSKVVYNSLCAIDIKWFPYDEQECYMKFGSLNCFFFIFFIIYLKGSWTYGGFELDMVHVNTFFVFHFWPNNSLTFFAQLDTDEVEHVSHENGTVWNVELGVDISEYQESVEFELLSVIWPILSLFFISTNFM